MKWAHFHHLKKLHANHYLDPSSETKTYSAHDESFVFRERSTRIFVMSLLVTGASRTSRVLVQLQGASYAYVDPVALDTVSELVQISRAKE